MGEKISTELQHRVNRAIHLAGGPKVVAEKTGFSLSGIYKWMKFERSPSIDFLYALVEAARIRPEWLFIGVPPVSDGDDSGDWETHGDMDPYMARVPIRDQYASAGDGRFVVQEEAVSFSSFPRDYLETLGPPDQLNIIRAGGDSMEPDIQDDAFVMFDQSDTRPREAIFVMRLDDALLIKRLRILGGGRAELVSSNPAYPPVAINFNDGSFDILGRVVWSGRKMK